MLSQKIKIHDAAGLPKIFGSLKARTMHK